MWGTVNNTYPKTNAETIQVAKAEIQLSWRQELWYKNTTSVEFYKELTKWSLSSNFPSTCATEVHMFLEEPLTSLNQGQTVTGLAGGERNEDWEREPIYQDLLSSFHLI